jgi:hypothetical protein
VTLRLHAGLVDGKDVFFVRPDTSEAEVAERERNLALSAERVATANLTTPLSGRERKRERGQHDEREQRTAGTGSWSDPQGSRAAETFGQVSLESRPTAPTSVSTPLRDVVLRSV